MTSQILIRLIFGEEQTEMTQGMETKYHAWLREFQQQNEWSADATDYQKTLVNGNLNGFVAYIVRKELEKAISEAPAPAPLDRKPLPAGWWGWDSNGEPIKECPDKTLLDDNYGL